MAKHLLMMLSITLGAIISGPLPAAPVVFGQLNGNYELLDTGNEREYRLNDVGSRLGFTGAGIIDGDREWTYMLEGASDIAGSDEIFHELRQGWVGIRRAQDEIRIGRHLSPTRVAVAPVDLFADQAADQNTIFAGDKVINKSLVYLSHLNEFAYAVAFSLNDNNEHSALDVLVNYNNDNTYFAAAYLKGYDQQRVSRLAAIYRFPDGHQLGAAAEYLNDQGAGDDHKALVINGGYQLDDNKMLKAQAGANRSSGGGKTETLLGVGMDYRLSATALLRFQYSLNKHTDHQDAEEQVVSAGVLYKF